MRRIADYVFAVSLATLIVLSLVVIGNIQAGQYRGVVNQLTAQHNAIICILEIEPAKRTPALVAGCLERSGLKP